MSIRYLEDQQIFMINTAQSTYAFMVDDGGRTAHLYWGARLNNPADLPTIEQLATSRTNGDLLAHDFQEYRGYGGYSFIEPSLKVRFADGTRTLYLEYTGHEIVGDELRVFCRDVQYPLEVTLVYTTHEGLDLIERRALISNLGDTDVMLEQAYSATWFLPRRDEFRLTSLTGGWAEEYRINHHDLTGGRHVLETRTGLSGPDAAPYFVIDEDGRATEDEGAVYFFTLAWSGNWKGVVEREKFGRVVVTAGVNDFDFEWRLTPGEVFETPVMAAGYVEGGFGEASREMHDYERQVLMHPVDSARLMPVVFNAYGTFFHEIDEKRIMSVIDTAEEVGVELLVIDAGWQGEGDVHSMAYRKGMGTWNVNHDRFPRGLAPIKDELHRRGMLFGLWMEPEVVHPENELLRDHPDWIFRFENRPAETWKGSYVLNFARDDVREYVTQTIIRVVTENEVDCLKLDLNRLIPHMGWQGAEDKREKEAWVRYVHNIYRCYEDVKAAFPDLLIENCAAGGMRVDPGMLRFSGRINRSDNQDPLDILTLHEGFTQFMLPKLAGGGCMISDVFTEHINNRVSPMKYQAHVAMMGSLSIGKNLARISSEQKEELASYVAQYKELRHITQHGDLYRLVSPREKPYAVFCYVSKDRSEAAVFVLGQSIQFRHIPERLKLRGLDPDRTYAVSGYPDATGRGLMEVGVPIDLDGTMQSLVFTVTARDANRPEGVA